MLLHRWQVWDGTIRAPAELAGRPVLHNGIFVSGAGHKSMARPRSPRDTTPPDVPLLADFD